MRLPSLEQEVYEPLSWIAGISAILIAFMGPSLLDIDALADPRWLGVIAGVLVGFVAHELMHRNVARAYGLSAEFVAYTPGLLVTVFSALLPVRILVPGYVRIRGVSTRRGYALSIAGGPSANIFIAMLGAISHSLLGYPASRFVEGVVEVNLWLAFFNLLPIPPLDGYRLASLDARIWLCLLALVVLAWILW
ncbi:MAG: hypothetical protein QXS85_03110 [Acidilobaceae archaeon]